MVKVKKPTKPLKKLKKPKSSLVKEKKPKVLRTKDVKPNQVDVNADENKKPQPSKTRRISKKNDSLEVNKSSKKVKKGKKEKREDELEKHKKELENLKDIDPEFYKFLKQNDKKLLEFNFYDSDEDVDDEDNENETKNDDSEEEDDIVHKPSSDLEVASDEYDSGSDDYGSENDNKEDDEDIKAITVKVLNSWQFKLQKKHVAAETIRQVIHAFRSVLSSLSGETNQTAMYKVEGPMVFNGVIQLCVLYLEPAILSFLGVKPKHKQPLHKCKKWKKIRSCLRLYFVDLAKLLEHISSAHILTVILKHLHGIANMVGSFLTVSKTILKRLIILWSTSEETVRVLSFLCILKITRNHQISLLNHVLKAMYLSYVRNSKFVSPNTLPGINFMRRSLVEMFSLDLNTSYQHVFLYLRHLAIHERNALILKKKESFQAVYNWQYINSIRLWSDLLGATSTKPQLRPLIYPFVLITIAVIKLIPTAQFFPLRFHCIHALISLQCKTNIFIPVLPLIVEVLNSNTFNKKHTVVSMRPLQFTCILRLNKSQLAENGFRDEVVENVCGLMLEYLNNSSSSLGFPDLVVPAVVYLKNYLKNCKNSNHSRKLKQLLDKIIENSKFIEEERRKVTLNLNDINQIQAWETMIKNKNPPLSVYYLNWVKTYEMKKKRQAADTDEINKYDIPFIKRKKFDKSGKEISGEVELFPSDDEDELGFEKGESSQMMNKNKNENLMKKEKLEETPAENVKSKETEDDIKDDGIDIVKDLDVDDW